MNSSLVEQMLPTIISELEYSLIVQDDFNLCYNRLVDFVLEEAEKSLASKGQRCVTTKHKEYWDDELSKNWKYMKECERLFKKSLKNEYSSRRRKFEEFKSAQKIFDKNLKQKKRSYSKGKMPEVEKCCNTDPKAFWDYVNKLGPRKRTGIPWKVEIQGKLITDKNLILEKWRSDYEKLYSVPTDKNFSDDFKADRVHELPEMVGMATNAPGYAMLNAPIRLEEVKLAVKCGKPNKAVGLDQVSNELLKNEVVIKLLHCLFNMCLQENLVLVMWRSAIIHPIPKESGKVIDPLKYRGLALQLCILKVFSNILNEKSN